MKKIFLYSLLFISIISFTYHLLFRTFYQQDEWWIVGRIFTEQVGGFTSHFSLIGLIAGGGRPLSIPLQYFLYNLSLFKIWQLAVFALSFHFFNTMLLFLVVNKLTKSGFMTFVAGLFFATSSIASQAVIWAGTSSVTLPSTFFAFLSIYFYIFFLQQEEKKYLYTSLGFALISYFFKESTIFLFIFLPAMYVLYSKKRGSLIKVIKIHIILIGYACLAISLKLFELFTVFRGQTTTNVTGNSHSIVRLLLHFIFYPFESLSQMFIDPNIMWSISEFFGKINYPRVWNTAIAPVATETIGAEMISIILSTLLLILFYIIYKSKRTNRKMLLFGMILACLSFLPYTPLEKGNAYLESRYFYIGVAGAGILLAVFFDSLRLVMTKKIGLPLKYSTIFTLILISAFIIYQVSLIQRNLQEQTTLAYERKNFLASVSKLYPTLPNRPVFYLTSNHEYYVVGQKAPFQQGMGYTLMVWYYQTGVIPKEFLQQTYLWGITDQGYKEIGGRGFGYYWDMNKLKEEVKNRKIDKKNVIGVFYNAKEKKLFDITPSTIREIGL